MSKKSEKSKSNAATSPETTDAAPAAASVAVAERPSLVDPFAPLRLAEWFETWPGIFARRWPESFRGLPFVAGGFKMEQVVIDGALVIRGELPGLDADKDVTITVDGDHLVIAGEREDRSEETIDGRVRSEFQYGRFERSVRLPVGARTDEIDASYTDGILEVRVPFDTESSTATTIPIVQHH